MTLTGGARTDLVRLRGIRLATASELDAGERLNERLVKEMTGGEPITARALYQAEIEFRPVAKYWWSSNNLPVVRGTDEGIWRRLQLIPFKVTFGAESRDPNLVATLRSELPGILAWSVRGCLEWQSAGLGVAKQVTAATSAFRGDSDQVGRFVADACVRGDNERSTKKTIRKAFESWCEDQGERPGAARALTEGLRRLGLREGKVRAAGEGPRDGWIGLAPCSDRVVSVGANSRKPLESISLIEDFREKTPTGHYATTLKGDDVGEAATASGGTK